MQMPKYDIYDYGFGTVWSDVHVSYREGYYTSVTDYHEHSFYEINLILRCLCSLPRITKFFNTFSCTDVFEITTGTVDGTLGIIVPAFDDYSWHPRTSIRYSSASAYSSEIVPLVLRTCSAT